MNLSFRGKTVQLNGRSKGIIFTIVTLTIVFGIYRSSRSWGFDEGFHSIMGGIPEDHYAEPQTKEALGASNFIIGKKVAVIVETRPMDTLVPLILHFASVLGQDWPIMLFTDPTTTFESAPFQRAVNKGRISIIGLPDYVHFSNSESVSSFLASAWFWEQLDPADHVLLFQSDSILCANSPRRVEDFLEYDLIGAPVSQEWGHGFNGGLSLRNRNLMLDIVRKNNFTQEFLNGLFESAVEDQWFYNKSVELSEREDYKPAIRLPFYDVAGTFAVETIYYEKPLGYHQVRRWQADKLDQVEKWCPEYRLSTSDFLAAKVPSALDEDV